MSTPRPVLIGRALQAVLTEALADLDIPVDRDRDAAVRAEDMPRVLIFTDGAEIEADFIGGAQLRMAVFGVEMMDAAEHGETDGGLADRVATLRETVYAALMADRTLGGACLGLYVQPGSDPRAELDASKVRAETFRVMCAFATT